MVITLGANMKFYFQENIVTTSDVELQNLTELTSEQIAFYELHKPNVSVEEILNCELNPVPVPSLSELKAEKLNELNAYFGAIFAAGYEDTETGWKLFCGESNVIDYALLLLAITKKADEAEVKIGTFTGWQTSTKAVVMPLIDRYTEYMLPCTTTYRETKTNIEYAPDEATLDLIQW